MNKKLYEINDYKTEQIFSVLRWIFLVVAVIFFYYPPIATILDYNTYSFLYLLIIGFAYMTVVQISLLYMPDKKRVFGWLMKTGILFDYLAFNWLLLLSGGVQSPLYPIAYLYVMHATIYWRIPGAFISFLSILVSYTVIFFLDYDTNTPLDMIHYQLNLGFLFVVGLFGALIVNQERHHQTRKIQYKNVMNRDYLTGLYNHRYFKEQLIKCSLERKEVILAMIDIDYFKKVNDTYGHVMGDYVLKQVSLLFDEVVPSSKGTAFRYGGEEFAILFYTSNSQIVKSYISTIMEKVNNLNFESNHQIFKVTLSFGVTDQLDHSEDIGEFVKAADHLLYKAKELGRNQAVFSDGDILTEETKMKE
ncbi:GGDEF domain-containing protein [Bacillus sp. DJP31]|uniref:GGDEF domain-containing protein n=1 Tax=Bacillus sp. DJP31 TaxID=3409789 RepID=UPI003BB6A625